MEDVTPAPPEPTPAPATAAGGPHAEPDDREEIYYQGSPPPRGRAGRISVYLLISFGLIALAVLLIDKHAHPWWLSVAFIVLALILPAFPILMTKTMRYRISNYRIDYERGLFTKQIDTLELWHVEDLHFYQSFIDRIVNVGDITVTSRDAAMPRLILKGIPNPRPLYETLKQRVIAVKRQRGVLKVDPG